MTTAAEARRVLLAAARERGHEWRRSLDEERRRNGLERVPTFLLPVLLPEDGWSPLAAAVEALHRALVRLQRAYFDDGRFRDDLTMPDGAAPLARPAVKGAEAFCCRFDVVLHPDRPLAMKVLEVQVGDASGAGWTDLLWDGLERCLTPVTSERGFRLHSPSLLEAHRRAALEVLARAAASRETTDPLVAFACACDSFVRSDHEAMAALYQRFGTRAVVVDPRDIVVTPDGLVVEGEKVHLLVRDTVDEYVLEPFTTATAGLRAHLAAGGTPVLPPFRDALLDDKRALALLSSGAADELLDDESRAAVKAHLPWTRVLDDDTRSRAIQERAALVLKPADGYGGFGVVLGDTVTDEGWAAALADARARPSILQERLVLPRAVLPSLEVAGDDDERWLCVSLWCHGGGFSGGYARASLSPVVNVHQGGGIVPLAFVR